MFKKYLIAALAALFVVAAAGTQTDAAAQSRNRCSTTNLNSVNLLIIGLTSDQRLVCFSEFFPSRLNIIGQVTGLAGDTALIGIDYRVQDGKLYGVGNMGGVYTLSTVDGSATLVNNLTMPLIGTAFGVDFNPAADRLRIISNTGQNLRHNVNPGGVTLNDGTLTYTAPPATPVTAPGVTAAAYTNNDLDGNTVTTLFDIDSTLDQISVQSPANNGILVATGKLGFDTAETVGFDIYSTLSNGTTVKNRGYAALTSAVDGRSRFYRVSLLTGRATLITEFNDSVIDLAIPLNQ
jgi:hypothetical protein